MRKGTLPNRNHVREWGACHSRSQCNLAYFAQHKVNFFTITDDSSHQTIGHADRRQTAWIAHSRPSRSGVNERTWRLFIQLEA